MVFDCVLFISCFLPAALLLYWLIPGIRGKNTVLLVLSLLFYAFAGIPQLIILLALSFFTFLLGICIRREKLKKPAFIVGICLNLAYLCIFKYLNFFFTQVFSLPAVELGIALPLGISFFTFNTYT